MTEQINPQVIIDEFSRRIQSLTLENVVLAAQVSQLKGEIAALIAQYQSQQDTE